MIAAGSLDSPTDVTTGTQPQIKVGVVGGPFIGSRCELAVLRPMGNTHIDRHGRVINLRAPVPRAAVQVDKDYSQHVSTRKQILCDGK